MSKNIRLRCRFVGQVVLVAAFVTPAQGQAYPYGARVLPPLEYDHQFEGAVIFERHATQDELRLWCANKGSPIACSKIGNHTCLSASGFPRAAAGDIERVREQLQDSNTPKAGLELSIL